MKKTATAMLGSIIYVVASGAAAQSSVTVMGLVDVYGGSIQYGGDPSRRTVINSGGMSTSWFGFKGSEDLGGNMKAEFLLTGFFQADSGTSGRFGGDNLFSRDALVALSGGFGKITLGRTSAPSFLPAVQFNPFGDSFAFSPLILHTYVPAGPFGARNWIATVASDSGWSNLVIYSPPKLGDLQFNFYYQPGQQSDNNIRNYAVNAFFTRGNLGLTASYHQARVSNPNSGLAIIDATATPINYSSINRQESAYVGARYDFTVLKAFATYRQSRDDTLGGKAMKDNTYSAGLSVPAGNGSILLAYANTDRSGTLVGRDLKRDTLSMGYDYTLSKRTDLYTVYMSDKLSNSSRANSYVAGIRHRY